MPVYDPARAKDVRKIAEPIIEKYYPEFVDKGLKIDYLFAHAKIDPKTGFPTGPAIKVHGVAARGKCKVVSLKDRAKGNGDVEITVDGDWWDEKETRDRQRTALVHHELHHIVMEPVKVDDLGRPKVSMRDHDFQVGWFAVIANTYGTDSCECEQAKEVMDEFGQYFWPFLSVNVTHPATTRMANLEVREVRERHP